MVWKRFTYPAIGAGRATQLDPPSPVRARATQDPAAHDASMPITNPVLFDTKVTEPGSKPLGTAVPAGGAGRGIVVVVVVVDVGAVVLVVVVAVFVLPSGAFFLAAEQDAAPSARQSTSATLKSVREPVIR
jgi:hypothetical protein